MSNNKLCTRCGLWKSRELFHKRALGKDGLQAYCKECNKTNWYAYKEESQNKERRQAYLKEWNARPDRKAIRLVYMERWYRRSPRQNLRTSRIQALKRRLTENPVSLDELMEMFGKQEGKCAVSGLTMTWRQGEIKPTSITIDRIDPDKGYELSNVRLVCYAVNMLKGRGTDEDMFEIALAVVSNMKKSKLRLVS